MTDASGTPIPAVTSPNGFPAFGTWADGCAATVAALLQPIMEPIVTALKAGGVSVPGIFLFDVDQSPWCAPSADGIPCYASEVLAGEIVEALLKGSSGQLKGSLTSYSNTGADLHAYEKAAYVTASDQGLVATKNAALSETLQGVAVAQDSLSKATRSLRRLALEDYTNGAASRFESSLVMLGSPDEQDAIGQYLLTIAASRLTDNYNRPRRLSRRLSRSATQHRHLSNRPRRCWMRPRRRRTRLFRGSRRTRRTSKPGSHAQRRK